jgi:hypothetical protein
MVIQCLQETVLNNVNIFTHCSFPVLELIANINIVKNFK